MNKLYAAFLVVLFLVGCEESSLGERTAEIQISGFNPDILPTGFAYQGWILLNGTFVSIGDLTPSDGTQTVSNVSNEDLASADAFAVTIEPSDGEDAPSDFVFMVGDFTGNTATVQTNNQSSAGVQTVGFNTLNAFTIQTPTTASTTDDENGIWFFRVESAEQIGTLNLRFGEDYDFKAWLRKTLSDGNEFVFDLGTITNNIGNDGSSLFTVNTSDNPPFPGEEFVSEPATINYPDGTFPLDVRGGTLQIVIKPTTYMSSIAPFPTPLATFSIPVSADTGSSLPYDLQPSEGSSFTVTR